MKFSLPIFKETFHYHSNKSVEDLRADIRSVLDNSKPGSKGINLTGKFVSANEFEMTPKWQNTNIRNYETKISYLNGYLEQAVSGTNVIFTVRPNSIFTFFFFLFPVFALIIWQFDFMPSMHNRLYQRFLALWFLLFAPIFSSVFAYKAKKNIKTVFVMTFELEPMQGY